jgi:integrase
MSEVGDEPGRIRSSYLRQSDINRILDAHLQYAGLRAGELQALSWDDVGLDDRLIHVRRSWDRVAGFIEPKSRSGARTIPLPSELRAILLEHRLRSGRANGLVLGRTADRPFDSATVLPVLDVHGGRRTSRRSRCTRLATPLRAS